MRTPGRAAEPLHATATFTDSEQLPVDTDELLLRTFVDRSDRLRDLRVNQHRSQVRRSA